MIFSEICREIALSSTGSYVSLLISLLLLALVGSFSHCTFMCGPFVMAQIGKMDNTAPASEWQRLKNASLLPYHLGRISTYSLLGGIAAVIGSEVSTSWAPFSGSLLFITATFLVLYAIKPEWMNKYLKSNFIPRLMNIQPIKNLTHKLSTKKTIANGYFLGIILGFIPCAMVYIALTAAATTSNFIEGFVAMAVFGVGTIPALFALSIFGKFITENIQNKMKYFSKASLALAGGWLYFISINILTN